ncbi:acetyl-CoA carboxylase biotin carboxyl carrier protein subunit [Sulfolobus sp. A20]|uniref:biotin/lipoyl-containing protein n=1 Tax=Sulfolobaceae TaxID=118883 RepID=UPI000845E139|nr:MULTISPECIES: biotin/lipoyl-containing protein [unclassified Sulfolobus]TRM78234.1 acetyl-CoA carboxylase biotin carboxyl carrier protein subunit [Sulfolobus sp. B5]TRM83998.1 acetyl-CoA carboxylase biotin carboxyl carrier protein subunit [Sulfolobus sp. A20-N-F6]TRM86682.1 acetyl-CoA carboxylase biotin carboxyl carrier protein subunit [Sulfolobus sp. E3]TRM89076.1 acetyl-CoA carboxylase biotin carboxyl carrier protein subunit [Sulfolobus sp. C3]TRM94512.1 acetyl-CoA carboxylase biotin carb
MKAYRIHTELGDSYVVAYDQQGNIDNIKIGEKEVKVKFLGRGTRENEYLFEIDGKNYYVFVESDGTLIFANENFLRLDRINEIPVKEGESIESVLRGKEGEIISPLFGRIVKIRVREGDAVNKGQPLLSIEAMKAETVISSPIAGIVQKVMVKEGQSVKKGDILLLIK